MLTREAAQWLSTHSSNIIPMRLLVWLAQQSTRWSIDSTSPIRYLSESREIEHVTKIHEQTEIHLSGCWKFTLCKILVFSEYSRLVGYSVYIHSKSKLTYICTSRSRTRLHLEEKELLEAKYYPCRTIHRFRTPNVCFKNLTIRSPWIPPPQADTFLYKRKTQT